MVYFSIRVNVPYMYIYIYVYIERRQLWRGPNGLVKILNEWEKGQKKKGEEKNCNASKRKYMLEKVT